MYCQEAITSLTRAFIGLNEKNKKSKNESESTRRGFIFILSEIKGKNVNKALCV